MEHELHAAAQLLGHGGPYHDIGGNVRIGMEDCPYVKPGVYVKTNAELVEKSVRIAREIGREIASPDEARRIGRSS